MLVGFGFGVWGLGEHVKASVLGLTGFLLLGSLGFKLRGLGKSKYIYAGAFTSD